MRVVGLNKVLYKDLSSFKTDSFVDIEFCLQVRVKGFKSIVGVGNSQFNVIVPGPELRHIPFKTKIGTTWILMHVMRPPV